MLGHLIHLNDVIALGDTSTMRLAQQYHILRPYFVDTPLHIHLVASTFGDTAWTTQQLRTIIALFQSTPSLMDGPLTLCVNNASRAKHTNSGQAKGSACLRGTITGGLPHPLHIIGVDDDVFGGISDLLTQLCEIKGIDRNKVRIDDISKGSQFRSLEFWPLVQYIVQFTADPYASLIVEVMPITHLPHASLDIPTQEQQKLLDHLTHTLTKNLRIPPTKDDSTIYPQGEPSVYIQGDIQLHMFYQSIQLTGEREKTQRLWHLSKPFTPLLADIFEQHKDEHPCPTLSPYELIVIDKDKFGNIKTCSAHADGIHGIAKALGILPGSAVTISYTIAGVNHIQDAYLVESISDRTGEKCIWNGSSRGAQGKIFVELNRSIDENYQRREELDALSIGDNVTIASK